MSTAKEMSPAQVAEDVATRCFLYAPSLRAIEITTRTGFALLPVMEVFFDVSRGAVVIKVAGTPEIGEPQAEYSTETAPTIGVPETTLNETLAELRREQSEAEKAAARACEKLLSATEPLYIKGQCYWSVEGRA